jgi:hypothetical protein
MRVRVFTALGTFASLGKANAYILTLLSFSQAWDEAQQQDYK